MPFRDSSFAVAYSKSVFYYAIGNEPWGVPVTFRMARLAPEIYRLLKPDGIYCINDEPLLPNHLEAFLKAGLHYLKAGGLDEHTIFRK